MALAVVSSPSDTFVPLPPPVKRTVSKVPFALAVPVDSPGEPSDPHQLSTVELSPCSNTQNQNKPPTSNELDETTLTTLKEQGYTRGLAKTLADVKNSFAKRIFIVDNSGSMQRNDGHRLLPTKQKGASKIVPSTRWEEVRESINYHIRLCGLIQAPTSFRLLNHPGAANGSQIFGIAEHKGRSSERIQADVDWGLHIMNRTNPAGCTPLAEHMKAIYEEVKEAAPMLRVNGQRISVTICTDGLPSDPYGRSGSQQNREFVDSLRRLEGLPVWIVVRLCTDEDDVVKFYNELDGQLEISIEVLDDFVGEAKEVHAVNPWLNYGLSLHRLREFGFHDRVLDMLDERALTLTELLTICGLLFGRDKMDGVPDPSADWKGFRNAIEQLVRTENLQWNPRTKRMEPLIDIRMLDFLYGDSCSHLPCHPFQLFKFFQLLRCDQ